MSAETNFEKAKKLFEQGKYLAAQPLFEEYLKENPNHTKTTEYLGDIAGNQKSGTSL